MGEKEEREEEEAKEVEAAITTALDLEIVNSRSAFCGLALARRDFMGLILQLFLVVEVARGTDGHPIGLAPRVATSPQIQFSL